VISLFAGAGFVSLLERNWTLLSLKKVSFFLLLLGILFSSVSYMERISDYSPEKSDREVLQWIRDNTAEDSLVLSSPNNGEYINYFANRKPVYKNANRKNIKMSETLFSSLYVRDIFPILENNQASIIYVSKDMKERFPQDRSFLFLLKNERFKLIHSYENTEAWYYQKEGRIE